jgi:hypothetical protein
MTSDFTVIEMTPVDARLFIEFRRLYPQFLELDRSGFFGIKGGSAIVHFDNDSKIRKIERHDVIYAS